MRRMYWKLLGVALLVSVVVVCGESPAHAWDGSTAYECTSTEATAAADRWQGCPHASEAMEAAGLANRHRWSGDGWACNGKFAAAKNRWGDCLGETVAITSEPFTTGGTNPLKACSAHTGNPNHIVDATFDAKTDCAASGAQCTTWARRCKCNSATVTSCLAPNFANKPMTEAWMFEAHVNKAAITTSTIQAAVTDKVGLNYAAWQASRATTLAAAATEEELGEYKGERATSLAAAAELAAEDKAMEEEELIELQENGNGNGNGNGNKPAPPPPASSSGGSTSCTGTDWAFPSGMAYINNDQEGIVVAAMTAALSAKGLALKSSMKVNAVGAGNMPAAGEEASWGIKCGSMYSGCSGACGIITKLQQVGRGSCSIPNSGKIVFIKMGRITVPSSGAFTMPSHNQIVAGWVARSPDETVSTGCTGATKKAFLSDVDSALREGVAKARFTIAKAVMAEIATRRL